ncbi:PTS cellobiose transporter subunit IIC [Bacillus sp. AFS088145]|uniref:PTS cellobiose transporter subunit IIC n=1 Tax=Bacillus sp. AFS088145 TaxID=2033514 RepID=UPI000BF49B8A|nr:PTS cellobiose transporter subunit IIC [Bacillus sp. AFS088145]PFH86961.1 PTS system, cellobiose-specific IIC component [Bacillus sp. AFS088145]
MANFTQMLEEKVMPVAGKIAGQKHLQALRDGIILTLPLIIVGSIFLILGFLPFDGYPDFMAKTFGAAWQIKLLYPVSASFDIMALIAGFGIAYRLAEHYKVDALNAGAISIASFILSTPYFTMFTPDGATAAIKVGGVLPMAFLGSKGLFVAIIIALFSTEIYRWVIQRNFVIKMPDGVPPSVSKSFVALFPAFLVILLVWIIRLLIEHTHYETLHNVVGDLLQDPLSRLGGSLAGALIAVLLIQLLWSVGLHGAAIVGGVMGPVWLAATDANRLALQAHHAMPNVVTQQFFDIFIYMGGSGATICFALMMLLFAKSQHAKQLGRLSIGPGIFNINEPITFGAPVVMNPLLLVPFILTPLVLVVTTYIGMKTGFAPKTHGIAIPWTTPPIIGGWLATGGNWRGSAMQLINLVVAFLIYFPFFRMWDKQNLQTEQGSPK